MQETWVQSLGWEDSLEEGMATHSSILARRVPMDKGVWRAVVHGVAESRHDWVTKNTHTGTGIVYSTLHGLFYLVLPIDLRVGPVFSFYFTKKETKSLRGWVSCPLSQSQLAVGGDLNLGPDCIAFLVSWAGQTCDILSGWHAWWESEDKATGWHLGQQSKAHGFRAPGTSNTLKREGDVARFEL